MTETSDVPTLRVMALHALKYCERLFYLEEVEEIRVADAAVWAGRRLHRELEAGEDLVELVMESEALGIRGKIDALRRRDGSLHVVEHKRGRARTGPGAEPEAWDSDRVQAVAYAMLLAEHLGERVDEARVRYHGSGVTVRIGVDDERRGEVRAAIERGRALRGATERPPVTSDERRCPSCSLAPVCLPEESRFARRHEDGERAERPLRLFPADAERRSLHVVTQGARVGRADRRLVVKDREGGVTELAVHEVSDVVLHGMPQVSTQALRLCADEGIPVHLVTMAGTLLGTFQGATAAVQRRVRQYRALAGDGDVLRQELARRVVQGKIEMQLRHLLRGTRGDAEARQGVDGAVEALRTAVRGAARASARAELMGYEGHGAKAYFGGLARLVREGAGEAMVPRGRSRRPPRDRFNALLSWGYGLLYRDVVTAILRVGLEPALGVLHQPSSTALPLALDVMELFRVPMVDVPVLGAVNRRTFDAEEDFSVSGEQVWLSTAGRRKLLEVYERRKHEEHRHPTLGYSLSWVRMVELEVRLLEKEWSGEPGLFARLRLR
jgi:CRISP-associated protein Cas1